MDPISREDGNTYIKDYTGIVFLYEGIWEYIM